MYECMYVIGAPSGQGSMPPFYNNSYYPPHPYAAAAAASPYYAAAMMAAAAASSGIPPSSPMNSHPLPPTVAVGPTSAPSFTNTMATSMSSIPDSINGTMAMSMTASPHHAMSTIGAHAPHNL
jgi:hypothetical protein